MKKTEKKMLVNHIKKDDKEFRNQIKDDVDLKKKIMKKSPKAKAKKKAKEKDYDD